MKRLTGLITALFLLTGQGGLKAQSFLPGYNAAFYPDVLNSAKSIALPFLLRQGYIKMPGVSVTDSTLHAGTDKYVVNQRYQNGGVDYTLPAAQYNAYGMAGANAVWPYGMPNILYNPAGKAWDCIGDCVSYVVRVLSATGDSGTAGNAYLALLQTIRAANTTPIAAKGYSSTAYQLGAAFPTLGGGSPAGWQYISGNVLADSIDATNHIIRPTVGRYNGLPKGGFAASRPGDVLAFSYPRSAAYNGHLMILSGAPELLSADSLRVWMPAQSLANVQSLLSRFRVYAVPVYDCSGKKAHFRDSRQTVSGIGQGTLLLLTSLANDVPQGFIFSPGQVAGSRINYDSLGSEVLAISVGRWKKSAVAGIALSGGDGFSVFPNPVQSILNVRSAVSGRVLLFDAAGRYIRQAELAAAEVTRISMADLPSGWYTLRLVSGDRVHSQALLKQ